MRRKMKIAGGTLKRAIVLSTFLPDHPEPFRRQQVIMALDQDDYTCEPSTLDDQLYRLLRLGYLERSHVPDQDEDVPRKFYWYRFAKPDRTSTRPGYRPGERGDLLKT